ncbi:MAG: RNA-binding transcriptional accessory protein [Bacteroidales bacterium]|nr:RNA-binding transcriptional accessory protein [Bacteroidales bacterium]
MNPIYISKIANKLGISQNQVKNTIGLLEYGATIPFISRYRKEMTGSLDEVQIADIQQEMNNFIELDKRREYILDTIEKNELLTPQLKQKIEQAETLTELEDLYLPYKPKRKTRAVKAKERGLEPLATEIFRQQHFDLNAIAQKFINNEVPTIQDALQGARDIIAENISEDIKARTSIRYIFEKEAILSTKITKGKEEEGAKYKDYFNWAEDLRKMPSHRLLAVLRAENEKIIRLDISVDADKATERLKKLFVKDYNKASEQVELAIEDAYKRLLKPSIETEYKNIAKTKADAEAIKVFVENLRNLLLAPPLGKKRTLAIDPGFRSGCKVVTLDEQGNLLFNTNVYPFAENEELIKAIKTISRLVEQYKIDIIAIGNGTASKETEKFVKKVRFNREVKIYMVDESGASIYSASKTAREEFPNYDVTVRGAVSIGRRLLDPLSELVKIDPKSIGVGQYQHDVDQTMLKNSLDLTVESCVNLVGVDVNTSSKYLLTYVSGLGPKLAENIISYRTEKGRIKSRKELKKVKLMGDKAYEQAAGFLRVTDGENPLDASAVHPESYHIVQKMAKDLNVDIEELISNKKTQKKINKAAYKTENIGEETLTDILNELAKPGRDPRNEFSVVEFDETIKSIDDLYEGMIIPGMVKNVTNFGAFVDIGIKQNGLVHISEIADKYISNPAEIIKVHQHVTVKIILVDKNRERIALSMKGIKQE